MGYTVNNKPTAATIAELERQVRTAATPNERRVLQALLDQMKAEVEQAQAAAPQTRRGINRWFQLR